MSLERLIDEVKARNEAALDAERKRFLEESGRIAADRDRRVRLAREAIQHQAEMDATRERAQRLAAAKLDARKRLFEAQEHRAREALEATRTILSDFAVNDGAYASVLKRMYAYSVARLGNSARISGRREDASVLKSIAGRSFVADPVPILGGLIARTPDGNRRLNLSLDELLRLREDRIRELFNL